MGQDWRSGGFLLVVLLLMGIWSIVSSEPAVLVDAECAGQKKRIESLEEELKLMKLENEKNVCLSLSLIIHMLTDIERSCYQVQGKGKLSFPLWWQAADMNRLTRSKQMQR
jgi:hypothetical protein